MEKEWSAQKISDWVAQRALSKEAVWERVDNAIRGTRLESPFGSLTASDSLLTEAAFIAVLQDKADLPRSPDGEAAGKILFSSLAYLSTLPFPSSTKTIPQRDGLSPAQLARALVWIIPDNYGSIVEEGNLSRQRSKADHRRLIFQSLAARLDPTDKPDYDAESARRLALHNAFEVEHESRRDHCALNHDDDGDEIYHDLLDVLYGTQITPRDPRYGPVPRDAFRPVAKQLAAEHDLDKLYDLGIPVDRFVSLVKYLVALQFTQPDAYRDEHGNLDLSRFDAAARSICAAFCPDNSGVIITWPAFDHALKNITPYLLDPLYHLIIKIFLPDEPINPGVSYLWDEPSPPPGDTPPLLTMPLTSQLATLLGGSLDFSSLRRTFRYSPPSSTSPESDQQPSSELMSRAMETIPEEAILVFSAHHHRHQHQQSSGSSPPTATTNDTTTTTPSQSATTYIFGVFSYKPKEDRASIQNNTDLPSGFVGQERCAIFQLAPVQDVWRGVVGKPGWTVSDNEVVFGNDDSCGGMVLKMKDGCRAVDIAHRTTGGDGSDGGGGYVYEPNGWRGNWSLASLSIRDMEIWTDWRDES
ncbi:hypothetical protein QBC47DRAFT_431515 [Echria macrotheca]|uniref:TLDc domain-containing protein n=1 Tax=Echria macrotheca TaxID=438768 RepID=A0AAJ0B9E6_9PEZI|nr:hypothetical protein QBC47DRAFT_431515 [Echria macrotheca]